MTEIAKPLNLDAEATTEDLPPVHDGALYDLPDATLRNQQRGLYAGVGLKTYSKLVGLHRESITTAIGDLLGDLRHLCDALELDFDDLDQKGQRHYLDEIGGKG